jgi:hypothetical protein
MTDIPRKPNPGSAEGIANAKLVILRAKTDYDLLILIERDVDRGLALAKAAATVGFPLSVQAEKAYGTAMPLFTLAGLNSGDRVRIEGKLKDLRTQLDQVPALAMDLTATISAG